MNNAQLLTIIILSGISFVSLLSLIYLRDTIRLISGLVLFFTLLFGWLLIGCAVTFNTLTIEDTYELSHSSKSVSVVDKNGAILWTSNSFEDVTDFKDKPNAKIRVTKELNLYNSVKSPDNLYTHYEFVR